MISNWILFYNEEEVYSHFFACYNDGEIMLYNGVGKFLFFLVTEEIVFVGNFFFMVYLLGTLCYILRRCHEEVQSTVL